MNPEQHENRRSVNADATEVKGPMRSSSRSRVSTSGSATSPRCADVDLDVGRQEVVVVIGPSGSGKSTLIRCINRLETHDEGRIVVDGTELSDDIRNIQEIRRETGMVFQQFNLFPHLSVIDNITLAPRQVRRMPEARGGRARHGAARPGADPRAGVQVPGPAAPAGSSSGWRSPGRWR